MRRGSSLRRRVGLALAVAPIALQALAVACLGVNTVLWDEFAYVPFIRAVFEGGDWWSWMAKQHNEHRVVPMKLVMAPLARLTGWDNRAEMLVSVVLAALLVLGLWRLYRAAGGEDPLLFAPAPWLVCSLAGYENILYGLMMCHYFTLAGAVWALVFLAGGAGVVAFVGAALCALVASFSILNGLLVWPLGLALLLTQRRRRAAGAWLVLSVAAFAIYFHDFEMPSAPAGAPPTFALSTLAGVAVYSLRLLGAPLAAGSLAWSAALGLLLVAASTWLAWRWLRSPGCLGRDGPLAALLAFGAASCAMIAVGRAAFAGIPPLQSRYVAYSSLVVVAVYLLLARDAERLPTAGARPAFVAALAILVPGLLAANAEGLRGARAWRSETLQQKMTLQTYDQRLPSATGFDPSIAAGAAYLRKSRLGPFADPVDALLLVRWQEGMPAGEILPGRSVEQTLVCPVADLQDFAVVFTAPPISSHVTISLWEGERRLAARELAASDVRPDGWHRVEAHVPRCRDRRLLLRVDSADARPGDAVTVWTYPRYYPGELRQTGVPQIAGRSVGLAMNGFAYGLLHE